MDLDLYSDAEASRAHDMSFDELAEDALAAKHLHG